jgi:hypothetical protein
MGQWRKVIRVRFTGNFVESFSPGMKLEDIPRGTLAVNFQNPAQTLELADHITQGMDATGFANSMPPQPEIPRGKVLDDMLVHESKVQFGVWGEPPNEQPVMTLTFKGIWMKDVLDQEITDPEIQQQAALFVQDNLLLAQRLHNEAERLRGEPDLPGVSIVD